MLDYGCGEALHADLVAAAADELLLCEGAPGVRAGIAARFAGDRENPRGRARRTSSVCRTIRSISSSCIRSRNI